MTRTSRGLLLNLRTEDGLNKSIGYFQAAIEKDPGYALAYAGLADTYGASVDWGSLAPKAAYPLTRAAALKAIQMDETLAETPPRWAVSKWTSTLTFRVQGRSTLPWS